MEFKSIDKYIELFKGRQDCYGLNGYCEKMPLTKEVLIKHFNGQSRVGVYPLIKDKTLFLALDVDEIDNNFEVACELLDAAESYGMFGSIERSRRKGYHVWFFFDSPVSAIKARAIAKQIVQDTTDDEIEIFPKQNETLPDKPYGNFINLPFYDFDDSLNNSGGCLFVDSYNKTIPDQFETLNKMKKVTEAQLDQIIKINHIPLPTKEDVYESVKQSAESKSIDKAPYADQRVDKTTFFEGSRNDSLTALAGSLRHKGLEQSEILETLKIVNQNRCKPPLPDKEISTISKSVSRYKKDKEIGGIQFVQAPNEIIWSEIKDLPKLQTDAMELFPEMIPKALRESLQDISERMQIPLDFVAPAQIVALSAIIGRKVGVCPKQKDDWLVIPNLWGALVSPPGTLKSNAISEAFAPLEKLNLEAQREFDLKSNELKASQESIDSKFKGIKAKMDQAAKKGADIQLESLQAKYAELLVSSERAKVRQRRYKTNDTTIEKLGELLRDNPNGILILRDELYGWFKSLDKFGREGDREFYLEGWNALGGYSVDRMSRKLQIPALCISLFGTIQPGKLQNYVNETIRGGIGDDGLLQRLQLLVYPNYKMKPEIIDRFPNADAKLKTSFIFEEINKYNPLIDNAQTHAREIPFFRFEAGSQELFYNFFKELNIKIEKNANSSPAFASHLAKYRSLMPSLALIFHLSELVTGSVKGGEIDIQSTALAVEWCTFLESHAVKVYSMESNVGAYAAQALIAKIKEGKIVDGDSIRKIRQHHWRLLGSVDLVESAVATLGDVGIVQTEMMSSAGRPSEVLRINPKFK